MKYEMLGKKFCEWYKKEYERVWDEWYGENVPDFLLSERSFSISHGLFIWKVLKQKL